MKEMSRENAREIFMEWNIDKCAEQLLEYKARGESVVLNHNGHKIYSCDINSADDVYQEIYGMTKKELTDMLEREKEIKKEKAIIAEKEVKANMPKWIETLKSIKIEELDERTFYEQVLGVIKGMEGAKLTPELAKELQSALEEIGCMKYNDWKTTKETSGETIENNIIEIGIEKADIGAAVSMISQLMYDDHKTSNFGLAKMLDGGVQQWIKNSQGISKFNPNIPDYKVEQAKREEETSLTEHGDKKNSIIQRIMTLSGRRRKLKEEISKETENTHDFDE